MKLTPEEKKWIVETLKLLMGLKAKLESLLNR